MGIKRVLAGLALAAAVVPALLQAPALADEPLKIRIGWGSMPAHLIPALYQDTSALKHYGKSYVVEPQQFSASTPQITALASGDIDFAAFSPSAFVLGVVNANLDLQVVADIIQDGKPGHYSQSIYVKADSPIKTVQDLKGKTVGVNGLGSAVDNALRAMLAKNGMNPKTDVRVVETSFANILPMLNDGKIDAGPIQQPMASKLVKEGKYRLLFNSADAMGPTQFVALVGRKSFLDAHRAQLMDFFEDHVRAIRWIMDPKNRDKALPIIAKASVRPVEQMSYLFTDIDYYRDPWGLPDIAGLQRAINVSAELGVVPKTIEVSPDHVDLSFVEEAKKRIEANP
ncbi:ABC transporter substrate-binding protein [Ancylobacter mangrovi]|uniref:ABC transporter substrate-binding protein n=1 Tax=Ancylobacter mangrovi TaxID=2972472 RepID=A0A9X2PEM3_9HYPH|nr:ABC transporter substrate-binding protein [Ancylobacter mangrovi]MCS0494748.1 ABC transporter substrate-binding protein [Ancylobacter mangrovi]MCS0502139.1 ABC transporter substrate-binding protein [Ancylobacter mangrovi]